MARLTRPPRIATTGACLVAAACLAATPAPAQTAGGSDSRTASSARPASPLELRTETDRSRFRRELDRADVQLELLSTFHWTRLPGAELHQDQVLSDTLVDEVANVALRAGRRAARDYLLQIVSVDEWAENLLDRGRGRSSATGAATSRKRLDWDLGVHSAIPEGGMRYFIGDGEIKLAVAADGELGLRFRARGPKPAEVGVSFDGDETYRFNFSFGF